MSAILKPQQAADYLGVSRETLAAWRYRDRGDQKGRSPRWVEANGKCLGYTLSALDTWVAASETNGAA